MENGRLLELKGIDKHFGGVHALDDVSFDIYSGQVHAIVGENGAGKSTLMKILAGTYQPDKGEIILNEQPSVFNNPRDSQAAGISIIYQELNNFQALSATANIFVGRELCQHGLMLHEREMRSRASEVFKRMGVDVDLDAKLGTLSVSEQQLVEIAKALVYEEKLVIMDEPNSALTDKETQGLFEIIRRLRNAGVTILYVSHRIEEVFQISDCITVLRDGRYIGTWNTKDTTTAFIISQMVGREINEQFPPRTALDDHADVLLKVQNLYQAGSLESVSFSLHRGEILGFAGLEGSGIADLFHTLFGLKRMDRGDIWYQGTKCRFRSTLDAIRQNWGLIPANRRDHGLFMKWSIKENSALVILLRLLNRVGLLSEKRLRDNAHKYIGRLKISTDSLEKLVSDLSGGNQQKVVVAKWLATHPKILILHDPTRGIDVGAKAEIYKLINDLAHQGISLLFTSSEIDEVIGLAHRILVMRKGQIVKEYRQGTVNKNDVLLHISGDISSGDSRKTYGK